MNAEYCVSGRGYSGEVSCLREAVAIVRTNKNGGIYKLFLSYEPYIHGDSLAAEILCDCQSCQVQAKKIHKKKGNKAHGKPTS